MAADKRTDRMVGQTLLCRWSTWGPQPDAGSRRRRRVAAEKRAGIRQQKRGERQRVRRALERGDDAVA